MDLKNFLSTFKCFNLIGVQIKTLNKVDSVTKIILDKELSKENLHLLSNFENLVNFTIKDIFYEKIDFENYLINIKNPEKLKYFSLKNVKLNKYTTYYQLPEYIKKFRNLEHIYLDNINIEKLNNIDELKNLKNISIINSDLRFIEISKELPNLKSFQLSKNNIQSFNKDMFSYIPNLKNLYLRENKLSNIEWINLLNNIDSIDFDHNIINNIDYHISNINLKSFSMIGNDLINIDNLGDFPKLESFNLNYNQFNEIPKNQNRFPKLKIFSIAKNNIDCLDNIETFSTIENLTLWGNKIKDIILINNLKDIKSLDLNNNEITEFNVLENLDKLYYINIHSNKFDILDIEKLSKLPKLQSLTLKSSSLKFITSKDIKIFKFDLTKSDINNLYANYKKKIIEENKEMKKNEKEIKRQEQLKILQDKENIIKENNTKKKTIYLKNLKTNETSENQDLYIF